MRCGRPFAPLRECFHNFFPASFTQSNDKSNSSNPRRLIISQPILIPSPTLSDFVPTRSAPLPPVPASPARAPPATPPQPSRTPPPAPQETSKPRSPAPHEVPLPPSPVLESCSPVPPKRERTPPPPLPDFKFPDSGVKPTPAKTMLIKVRTLTGKEIELDVESDYKVFQIKEKVEEKEGIPPVQQRLIFGGKQMVDDKTAAEYNLEGGATLHLVLALRGGF